QQKLEKVMDEEGLPDEEVWTCPESLFIVFFHTV
ncbi:uncharacterized, partial [Tachysurus ichikawai]